MSDPNSGSFQTHARVKECTKNTGDINTEIIVFVVFAIFMIV